MRFEVTNDMDAAFDGADVVYPKSWGCLELHRAAGGVAGSSPRATRTGSATRSVSRARSRTPIYLHCLPADRGNEVADEVIDGPQSVVFFSCSRRPPTACPPSRPCSTR